MIDGLKPYPDYKDTGLLRLARIPVHWDARRIRQIVDMLVSNVDKHSRTGEQPVRLCNYIDVYKNERITSNLPFMHATATDDEIETFRLRAGDVLLTKDSEEWTDIGVPSLVEYSAPDLVCGYHLAILRCRPVGLLGTYLLRALQCQPVAHQFHVEASGVTRYGLSHSSIKNVVLPVPPSEEQPLIVRFLDHANRRIECYIRAKRKLIALLNEQKQTIIHRAVTRGLDLAVPLKPSRNPWLGKIPEHWEERRAKYFYREVDDRSLAGAEELLSVSHITGVTPRSQKNITMFMAASYIGHKTCEPGDIVINTMWAWMGALGVAGRQGIVSPSYGVYRPLRSDTFVPQFVDCLLRTKPFVDEYRCRSTGIRSSRLRLYPEQFLDIPLILPPYREQERITAFVTANTRQLDNLMAEAAREIDLLREYRTRLITDVVTGQLDVREAAALLPEEIQESELPYADSDDAESIAAEGEPIEAEA